MIADQAGTTVIPSTCLRCERRRQAPAQLLCASCSTEFSEKWPSARTSGAADTEEYRGLRAGALERFISEQIARLPLVIVDFDSFPLTPVEPHNWATQLTSGAELKAQQKWRKACEAITPVTSRAFAERDTLRGV